MRDEAFLRVGEEDRRPSFDQRDTTFETTPARTCGQAATLDDDSMAGYAQRVGHPNPRRLLQARDLVALMRRVGGARTDPNAYWTADEGE